MNFNFLAHYRDLAINTYDVDPVIFIVLIIISIPFYYYSLYVMGKTIIHLKTEHKLRSREILKHHEFVRALVVNQIAWFLPYIYVIFWGRNIPIWIWILLAIYISFAVYLFFVKLLKKVK